MCRPYPLWGCVGNSGLVDRTAAFDRLRGAYVDGGVTIDVDIAKVRSGDVAEHVAVVTVVIVVVDEDEAIVVAIIVAVAVAVAEDAVIIEVVAVVAIVVTVAVAVAADKPAVVVKEPVVVLVVDYRVPAEAGHDGGGLKDARSVLGAAGVGSRLEAHGRDRVVAAAVDVNRLTHPAGVAVLLGLLTNIDGRRYFDVADVAEYVAVAVVVVELTVVAIVAVAVKVAEDEVEVIIVVAVVVVLVAEGGCSLSWMIAGVARTILVVLGQGGS